ncbi:hypothetical protein [uncultured Draconibacterium sp.]|uniref:hypothetical protein n=1 Tax=uncultured Draconibacterium sp. TaxID=1573823 RepID=UPI002AA8FE8A|nr:hypothetical protein [uncultured Draconibacterium sp.]
MKTILLISVFCLISLVSQAQWSYKFLALQKHHLYSTGEYIVGQQQAGNIGLNYTLNNKYTLNIGYSATFKTPVSPSPEFLKSVTNLTPASSYEPFENAENLYMMVGRILDINRSRSIRIIFQGGPGIASFRQPEFNLTKSGDQYNFETIVSKKLSLVLNPKIEMPLCCNFGCSVGPMVVINSKQTYIGAGIGLMYGLIKHD